MIKRYDQIPLKTGDNGKRVVRSVIYPPIPRDLSDIYLLTTPGDRLDLIAQKYYGDVGYWWIIAEANGIGKGDLTIPPGTQVRVPTRITDILREYKNLNS